MPIQPPVAVVFTQQTVGLGGRKTSMVFIAEGLAAQGYDVYVVTTQLSWLSRLRADSKLAEIRKPRRNRWYSYERLQALVWVPPVHPISVRNRLAATLTAPLIWIYGALLPRVIRERLQVAKLVLVESCAAVALFRKMKRIAPEAAFIYSMSDRLNSVGMHPGLHKRLLQDAPAYDLVRVPASGLLGDLPGARSVLIRHGLQKDLFDSADRSPYARPGNAVLIGDMQLDEATFALLIESFPSIQFHYFGRKRLSCAQGPNLVIHGEVRFEKMVPYVKHADVGLALYHPAESMEYLAESSLKLIQYEYCQLPIVAPDFLATSTINCHGYGVLSGKSARAAMRGALASRHATRSAANVSSWEQVVKQMLEALARPPDRISNLSV